MKTKVISFGLDPASIDAALKELNAYREELKQKTEQLRKLVAERIAWSASSGFHMATHADVVKGTPEPNDVTVEVSHDGNVSIVFAKGKEAVFIEFGAGITNNGPVGSSPHPWSANNPTFTIGSYGLGNGRKAMWGYYNGGVKGKDSLVVTRGTPAAMPMYHGVRDALAVLQDLVEEVFGS